MLFKIYKTGFILKRLGIKTQFSNGLPFNECHFILDSNFELDWYFRFIWNIKLKKKE